MRSEGKVSLSFVVSETKVAALQSLSIRRLELMAAVLGKRLALSIANNSENSLHFGLTAQVFYGW